MVIRDLDVVEIVLYTVPLTVYGYYTPEEQMVMYYKDGSSHPGSPAEFDAQAVEVEGTNVNGLLSDKTWELIEELVLKELDV